MEQSPTKLPRVTIEFCTQCKWMLRAAYFAQELLSTFSTALGEVALQPSTGGTFTVKLYASPTTPISSYGHAETQIQEHVLWDRKAEGGFPETKELKRRVRDVIDPNRDLGHIDGHSKTKDGNDEPAPAPTEHIPSGQPIPRAINRLQASANPETAERKFTPMACRTPPDSLFHSSTALLSNCKIQ